MVTNNWRLYEGRYHRRIFGPRRRSLTAPLFTVVAALAVLFLAAGYY